MTNTQSGQDEQNVGNLEYSYSRQLAVLEQVRSGLADIGQSRVRVEEQMAMLAQSDRTVLEVSIAVGFDDVGAFARSFARHCGESPSAYRRRVS